MRMARELKLQGKTPKQIEDAICTEYTGVSRMAVYKVMELADRIDKI